MSEWDVYLWTRLDCLKQEGFFLLCILGGIFIGSIITFFSNCEWKNSEPLPSKKTFKAVIYNIFFWMAVLILSNLVPSSRDYAMIKILPRIANSELSAQIQKDVPEIYQIAVSALKNKLTENSN